MKRNELAGTVTIARISSSNRCVIRIKDSKSRANFVSVELDLSDFAEGLFGLAERPATLVIEHLEHVGKKREDQPAQLKIPKSKFKELKISAHERGSLEQHLIKHAQKKGWELNPYLGGQSSIDHHEKGVVLNFSYTRYV